MNDIIPHQLIRILSLIIGLIAIPLINIPIIGQLIIIMAISLTLIWTTNILRIQKVDNQKIIIQTYQYTAITIISLIILLTSKINTGLFTPYLILIITLIINYIVFRIQNRTEQESLNQLELVTAINLTIQLIIILLSNSYQSMFITQYTLQTGLIALILVIIPLIIQHPYIACTGPNEDQIRTLTLTLTISFMTISLIGLLSIISTITWYISLIIGIIGWIISITKYIKQSQKQATKIKTIQDLKKELGEKNT